jgi:hypothetical protein
MSPRATAPPPEAMIALATKVIDCERTRHPDETDSTVPLLAAFRGLQDAMSRLVGRAGFDALLRRALQLTKRERVWLARIPIGSSLTLEQLAERAKAAGETPTAEGAAALFAMVLHLFCSFIGTELTLRQVRQVWPDVAQLPAFPLQTPASAAEDT